MTGIFRPFLKIVTKKSRFFGARFPLKFIIFWQPLENFRVSQPGYLIIAQKGTLWVGRWSNPWGGGRPLPPLNPLLWAIFINLFCCNFHQFFQSKHSFKDVKGQSENSGVALIPAVLFSSGFRERRVGARSPPLRVLPPADPKGPPFVLFWDIHFWLTELKILLRAPSPPTDTNFEEGTRAKKKRNFFNRSFPKSA